MLSWVVASVISRWQFHSQCISSPLSESNCLICWTCPVELFHRDVVVNWTHVARSNKCMDSTIIILKCLLILAFWKAENLSTILSLTTQTIHRLSAALAVQSEYTESAMQLCFMRILIQLMECVNLPTTLGRCKEALYSCFDYLWPLLRNSSIEWWTID